METETLADLYWRQGHKEKALVIYQRLYRSDPLSRHFRSRLRELEEHWNGMGFRDILQHIVEGVDGGVACTLMAFDGIAVEQVILDGAGEKIGGVDLENLYVEYSNILTQVIRVATVLEAGPLTEVTFGTDKTLTITRVLTEEYFIALTLESGGNFGKGRYLLRRATPVLCEELG